MKTMNLRSGAVMAAMLLSAMSVSEANAADSVQVYGVVGAYLGRTKVSGDASSVLQQGPGGLQTSFLGFKGSEDLGNNYRAIFMLESFFRPDTGAQGRNATDPFFSRNSWVGVEGGFGRLTAGRQTNPTYTATGILSPFGTSVVFSPLVLQTFVVAYGSAVIGDTVWNNAIEYMTPEMSGFKATALYGMGEVPGQSGTANAGLHGVYRNGPFTAALSAQRVRVNIVTPVASQQTAYLGGATYDFKWLKLYGSIERASFRVGNSSKTYDAGLSIPVTATGSVLAEAAKTFTSTPAGKEAARLTASVGYDYFLSKRTDLYAIYVRDTNADFGSAGSIAFGMRHTF